MLEYVGGRLAAIREATALKQSEIGTILGCSNGAYSLYERNLRQPPLSVILLMSDRFGVSIDYLLGCLTPQPHVFADRLSELLAAHPDKSLDRFCELLSLHPIAARVIPSGVCFPNSKVVKELSAYLGCSIDFLVGLSDDPCPASVFRLKSAIIPRDPYADLSPASRSILDGVADTLRRQEQSAAPEAKKG